MSIKQKIFTILRADKRLWDKDKNEFELNQTLLFDLVEKLDERVIELLFSNETTKKKFFKAIKDVYIFDERSFRFFLEENRVNNSYTIYKNRIGLSDGKKFLKDSADVVLDFPYKDCVLEGGQSNEEGFDTYFEYDEKVSATEEKKGLKPQTYNQKQAKRKEIFFNQTLAQDEIDRLFDKKAFVNWKRFTCKGEEKVKELKRDENGTIRENLIIKGNNLLALHSLKSEFAGKVKLIYIDPPYNTGNDGFKYNDKFNHSTWLTFMKNRLEIARDLLSDDGVIFVSCDDNEQAYLKVLMDEIFRMQNFVSTVIDIVKPEGRRYGFIAQSHEYLLIYSKDASSAKMYEMTDDNKKLPYKDNRGNYDIVGLRNRAVQFFNLGNRPNLFYPFYVDERVVDNNGFMPVSTIELDGYTKVLPSVVGNLQSVWRWGKEKANKQFNEVTARKGKDGVIRIFKKDYSQTTMPTSLWQGKELITQKGTQQIDKLFNDKVFAFPKPEAFLQRIIEISTKPKDIVLDFHLGSGTTAAVAHKMGRQYIGIEQMDYINEITCKRVQKVIDGEQGGISKSVNWQGGGDFVYFELAQWNEKAKEKILLCKDFNKLKTFFGELYEKYFLNYNLKQKDFIEKTINEPEFQSLGLDEQKMIFIAMLDNNQMYINFSEIRDEKYGVGEEDIEMSEEFYTKG